MNNVLLFCTFIEKNTSNSTMFCLHIYCCKLMRPLIFTSERWGSVASRLKLEKMNLCQSFNVIRHWWILWSHIEAFWGPSRLWLANLAYLQTAKTSEEHRKKRSICQIVWLSATWQSAFLSEVSKVRQTNGTLLAYKNPESIGYCSRVFAPCSLCLHSIPHIILCYLIPLLSPIHHVYNQTCPCSPCHVYWGQAVSVTLPLSSTIQLTLFVI